jgi:capsular polysaccharide biosynthesis protein
MPDIFYLFSRWWKLILVIIIVSLLGVGTVLFFLPPKYLSTTTALPASTYLKDKASVFSNNLQQLYPVLGIPDDLDMIAGTGQLDTPYIAVAKEFNLYDHYKTAEQGDAAIIKAAYLLKKNAKVSKSDFGELKVKVWDTDKNLAPKLADAIMRNLQSIHQDIHNSNNVAILASLKEGKDKLHAQLQKLTTNSAVSGPSNSEWVVLTEQVQQYEKLIGQYQLMADSKSPVLIVVEKARASSWPDKPKKVLWLTATFVLSLVFALLLALLFEKRKPVQR